MEWRAKISGDVKDETRPIMVPVLQDNFSVAVVSEINADWLEEWVGVKLMDELGIKLPQKKAASKPFAQVFSAFLAYRGEF